MSQGVKELMRTDYAIATTGIAGPGGGSPEKPVGTVWISIVGPQVHTAQKFIFAGTRLEIIQQSTQSGLKLLEKELKKDLNVSKKI
jgi:nicotinamide-nucleotide amidase